MVTTLPAHGQSMLDNFIESYLRPTPPAAAPVGRAGRVEEPRRYRKRARDLRHARRARAEIRKRSRLRNLPTRPSGSPAVATVGAISGSMGAQPMTAVRTVNAAPTPTLAPTSVLSPAPLAPGPMSRALWIEPPEPAAVAAIVAERWPRYEPMTAHAAAEALTGENTGAWGAWFLVLALPTLAIGGAMSWIANRRVRRRTQAIVAMWRACPEGEAQNTVDKLLGTPADDDVARHRVAQCAHGARSAHLAGTNRGASGTFLGGIAGSIENMVGTIDHCRANGEEGRHAEYVAGRPPDFSRRLPGRGADWGGRRLGRQWWADTSVMPEGKSNGSKNPHGPPPT
jgi:hypothetical protein